MEGHAGWRGSGRDARCASAIRTTSHVMSDGLQGLADVDGFRRFFDLDDLTWRPVKQIFKQLTPYGVTISNNERVAAAERATDASRHFRDDFWHVEECRIFQPKGDEADGTFIQIQRQRRRVHVDNNALRGIFEMIKEGAKLM